MQHTLSVHATIEATMLAVLHLIQPKTQDVVLDNILHLAAKHLYLIRHLSIDRFLLI
jgi:hypothetical protein